MLGFVHYSPSDKLLFLLSVAYIPALIVAAVGGTRLLWRERYAAAATLVLSPILLISTLIPAILSFVIALVTERWLTGVVQ